MLKKLNLLLVDSSNSLNLNSCHHHIILSIFIGDFQLAKPHLLLALFIFPPKLPTGILKEVKSKEILKITITKSIFALCRISYSHQNQLTAFTFDWAQVQCSSHIYVTTSSGPSQSVRVWDQSGSSQLTAGPAGPTPTLWRHSVTASVTHLLLL